MIFQCGKSSALRIWLQQLVLFQKLHLAPIKLGHIRLLFSKKSNKVKQQCHYLHDKHASCTGVVVGLTTKDTTEVLLCPTCGQKFAGKNRQWIYKRHYRAIHLKLERYSCEMCGKKFSYYNQKSRHVKKCVFR